MYGWRGFWFGIGLLACFARPLAAGGRQEVSAESFCRVAEVGSPGPVYSLAWYPDAVRLAAAGYGRVTVLDNTGQTLRVLNEPVSFVWSVAFSADGKLLAAADQDGSVWVYETAAWKAASRLQTGFVYSLAFSPDGRRLAAGSETGELQVWDMAESSRVHNSKLEERILSLSWSARSGLIAAGLWNGDTAILDGETYTQQNLLANSGGGRRDVNGLCWAPDGRLLASAHQDAKIRVWKPGRDAPLRILPGHVGWVRGVSWAADNKTLASGGNDRKLRLWQARRGKLLATSERQRYPIWSVAWAPGETLLATGSGLYGEKEASGEVVIYRLLP
jgi:WD40 repeat protein